jgi:hypothetical protein
MPLAHPKDALSSRQRRLAAAKGIERRVTLFAHLHVNKDAAWDVLAADPIWQASHACLKCSVIS